MGRASVTDEVTEFMHQRWCYVARYILEQCHSSVGAYITTGPPDAILPGHSLQVIKKLLNNPFAVAPDEYKDRRRKEAEEVQKLIRGKDRSLKEILFSDSMVDTIQEYMDSFFDDAGIDAPIDGGIDGEARRDETVALLHVIENRLLRALGEHDERAKRCVELIKSSNDKKFDDYIERDRFIADARRVADELVEGECDEGETGIRGTESGTKLRTGDAGEEQG